ncbi:MAG: hypothetical protein VZS44_09730 [Bacilli bacterium]|nr:hypothetical protein [Bacilli bacterium]
MKILLVIDVQPTFKVEPYYSKIIEYINNNKNKYDKIIATRFINHKNSFYTDRLNFTDCMKREELEFKPDILLGKRGYGLNVRNNLKLLKDNSVDIIGCDTDACILATCFQLWDYEIDFTILKNYIYSSGGDELSKSAYDIICRNFGRNSISIKE